MSTVEKRTVSLPAEHAAFIDAKVASGAYASISEVVRAGLRALKERDEAVERWLRDEVAPAYDAMAADPSRGIPMESVFADIRARHEGRLKDRR
jgi:antitoxin ParD1/3/4